jgi:hypothetical protein
MKHSVIMKVGDNLIYQYAPYPKPVMETTSSPVEFNRALPEWEHTSKSLLIKPTDKDGFEKYIDLEKLHIGCPVPYELVEIYPDGDKKYARFSENPNRALSEPYNASMVTKTTPAPKPEEQAIKPMTKAKAENNVVAELVLNVDDDGDVYLTFKSLIAPIDLETKLFNSFLKKAREKGVIITAPKIEDIPANTGAKDQIYKLKIKV